MVKPASAIPPATKVKLLLQRFLLRGIHRLHNSPRSTRPNAAPSMQRDFLLPSIFPQRTKSPVSIPSRAVTVAGTTPSIPSGSQLPRYRLPGIIMRSIHPAILPA